MAEIIEQSRIPKRTLVDGSKVPAIGLGTFGSDKYNSDQIAEAVYGGIRAGYRMIDCASVYQNENRIGESIERVLKEGIVDRADLFITSKVWNDMHNRVKESCEKSLKDLRVSYLDLYLVHWPDPNVSMEETIGAVAQLKKEGKILHAGVSNFTKDQIEEAGKYCEIEAYQPQYSMLDGDNEAAIRWAAAQGMGIMSYGTLGGGILTGTYREVRTFGETDNRNRFYPYFREPLFSKVMELLEVMDAIAAERGVPLAQIAVNWTLQQPFITSCIAGAQSRKKVEENCAGLEWQLTEDEMHRLDQAIQRYQFPVQCGEVYQRR